MKLYYEYNLEGLPSHFCSSDNSVEYFFSYDAQKRLSCIKDQKESKHCFFYDDAGNLIQETLPNGNVISYEYDLKGNRIVKTLSDASKIRYKYEDGLLRAVERIAADGSVAYTHTYDQYALKLPLEETLLDRAGKLTKRYDKEGKLRVVEANHYKETIPNQGWNSLRQILKRVIVDCKGTQDYHCTYNHLGKIVRENEMSYSYHSSGDLHAKNHITYTYNRENQLVQAGAKQLQYDGDGNLIFDGDAQYFYDAADRLVSVKKGKYQVYYTYDAFNRRLTTFIQKFKGHQYCSYLYDGLQEIACYSKGDAETVCIPGLQGNVAIELKGVPYAPVSGCLGSINALLNHTGHLAEGYHYTALGEENIFDAAGKAKQPINPWRYLQNRFDKETGLYYVNGRYYNPGLGIFLSKEPISAMKNLPEKIFPEI